MGDGNEVERELLYMISRVMEPGLFMLVYLKL